MRVARIVLSLSFLLFSVTALTLAAEKPEKETPLPIGLFDAMDKGLVEVKLTPKSALECSIAVKNLSQKPLEIDMPAAFAGVPVLAQATWGAPRGGMGMGAPNAAMGAANGGMEVTGRLRAQAGSSMGGSRSGGNQSMGGGGRSGGMGGRSGARGGGGGGWLVEPEKTVRDKFRTVCLEYGKDDPHPGCDYQIVPIDSYTENKTTRVLCEMLNDGAVDQQSVQAAVWNQESGLSYDELSAKIYRPANNVAPRPWFSKVQIANSQNLLNAAFAQVEQLNADEKAAEEAELRAEEEAVLSESSSTPAEPVDTTVEDLTKELTK